MTNFKFKVQTREHVCDHVKMFLNSVHVPLPFSAQMTTKNKKCVIKLF